jgi:hypothetical protein
MHGYGALFIIFVLFYVFLCCSVYCLFCDFHCIVCVYMCTELLSPGGYPIAVKYNIIYHIISYISYHTLSQIFSALTLPWFMLGLTVVANHVFCMLLVHLKCCMEIWCSGLPHQVTRLSQLVQQNVFLKIILHCSHFSYYS